jgi:hypothetical protein
MNTPSLKVMPTQKKSDSEKIKNDFKWGKDCIDAGEGMVLLQNDYVRASRYRKQVNYDLYNGKMHPSDIKRIVNPLNLKNQNFPAEIQNHPITNPYIKSLVGDESIRRFDWSLKVTNEDAVSEKEKALKDMVFGEIESLLLKGLEQPQVDPNTPEGQQATQAYEQEVNKRLEEVSKRRNYEFQDLREIQGTHLLKYYQRKLNVKSIVSRAWEDALLVGEELYCVDIIANEPIARKCNPSNLYCLIAPDSYKLEDSDLIVEEFYVPISRVIDDYYEYLKPSDIEFLESQTRYKGQNSYGNLVNFELQDPIFSIPLGATNGVDINSLNTGSTGLVPFDTQNNVRVLKVVWRSLREIKILTYIDEEGQSQTKAVHNEYVAKAELGESTKSVWIGEWWEGTKIANQIYIKIQPRPVQFRQANNISKCASGYVGSFYKTNSSQVQSLFDLMKPYQYKYNIYYHRLEKLFINNIGKVARLDLAKIPDGWQTDKWLYYMKEMNLAVVDSFKEAKKGAATGKLAGNMADNQNVLDLSLGTEIQQHIQALEYIKNELDLITGITPERRGQIKSADQGLGVTQQSVQASSIITEWYFRLHDETKLRLMETLLETAKYCLRNGNKSIQYIADDLSQIVYNINGELLNEAEYGLNMVDSLQDAKGRQMLAKASEIALQTGQVDLIQMMDISSNESMASIRRKIEKSVQDKQSQEQQARQEENQIRQQELEYQKQLKQQELELQKYKIDADNQTKLAIAEIGVYSRQQELDQNNDGIPDPIAIADQAFKQQELFSKQFESQQKQQIENKKIETDKQLKDKELEIKKEEMKSKERLEKIKADNKLQVERLKLKNKVAGEK